MVRTASARLFDRPSDFCEERKPVSFSGRTITSWGRPAWPYPKPEGTRSGRRVPGLQHIAKQRQYSRLCRVKRFWGEVRDGEVCKAWKPRQIESGASSRHRVEVVYVHRED